MDEITTLAVQFIHQHIVASHSVIATVAIVLARMDTIIKVLLRFVPAETLKAALDRIEQRIDARIDKVAGVQPPQVPQP